MLLWLLLLFYMANVMADAVDDDDNGACLVAFLPDCIINKCVACRWIIAIGRTRNDRLGLNAVIHINEKWHLAGQGDIDESPVDWPPANWMRHSHYALCVLGAETMFALSPTVCQQNDAATVGSTDIWQLDYVFQMNAIHWTTFAKRRQSFLKKRSSNFSWNILKSTALVKPHQ